MLNYRKIRSLLTIASTIIIPVVVMLVAFIIFLRTTNDTPPYWNRHHLVSNNAAILISAAYIGILFISFYLAIAFASIIIYYKMRINGVELCKKDRIVLIVNIITIIIFGITGIIFDPSPDLGLPTETIQIFRLLIIMISALGFAFIIVMRKIEPGDNRVFWPLVLNWFATLCILAILSILGFGSFVALFALSPYSWIVGFGLIPIMLEIVALCSPLILFYAGVSQFFTARYRPDKLFTVTTLNLITLLTSIYIQLFSLHILGASIFLLVIIASVAIILTVVINKFFGNRQIRNPRLWQVLSISLSILFAGAFGFSYYVLAQQAPSIVQRINLINNKNDVENYETKTERNKAVDEADKLDEDTDEVDESDTENFESHNEDFDEYEEYDEPDEFEDEYDDDFDEGYDYSEDDEFDEDFDDEDF